MTTDTNEIRTACNALAALADQHIESTPGQRAYIAGALAALRWVLGETDRTDLLIPKEPLV